jgi:hypothetical protein
VIFPLKGIQTLTGALATNLVISTLTSYSQEYRKKIWLDKDFSEPPWTIGEE